MKKEYLEDIMKNTIINIGGMTGSSSVSQLKSIIGSLDGVGSVNVDLNGSAVSVDYEPSKTSLQVIKHKIEEMGYKTL